MHVRTFAAVLLGLSACAPPLHLRYAPLREVQATPEPVVAADSSDYAATVVVRYYPYSPAVAVVGWETQRSGYGLRALLRRDGELITDHQLYVSTYQFTDWRSFARADWHAFSNGMQVARPLAFTGRMRDVDACVRLSECSPYESLTARLPDALLRSAADSLVVRIRAHDGRESALTLHRELIGAYLRTVASVQTGLRQR